MAEKTKPFYGWVIAVCGFLVMGAATGIYSTNLGWAVRPVTQELGFMRGQFTLTATISTVLTVLFMPFFGTLFKKYGFRRVAIVGTIIIGLSIYGQSFSSQLWHFYTCAVIVGIFMNANGIMAVGILVTKWFDDKKGLAMGIAFAGSGVIPTFTVPIANYLVQTQCWRWGYRFVATTSLAILLPIIIFVVKDKPEDMGLQPYRIKDKEMTQAEKTKIDNTGFTLKEALRSPVFWFLAIIAIGITMSQAGPAIHNIAFMMDLGHPFTFASTIAVVFMLSHTVFKILIGMFCDRVGPMGCLIYGAACIIFPVLAIFAGIQFVSFGYAMFLGLATAGVANTNTFLTAEYFGRKDFERVYSLVSMFSYAGMAISFPGMGFVYDFTGSYFFAFRLIIIFGIVVCLSMLIAHALYKRRAPLAKS